MRNGHLHDGPWKGAWIAPIVRTCVRKKSKILPEGGGSHGKIKNSSTTNARQRLMKTDHKMCSVLPGAPTQYSELGLTKIDNLHKTFFTLLSKGCHSVGYTGYSPLRFSPPKGTPLRQTKSCSVLPGAPTPYLELELDLTYRGAGTHPDYQSGTSGSSRGASRISIRGALLNEDGDQDYLTSADSRALWLPPQLNFPPEGGGSHGQFWNLPMTVSENWLHALESQTCTADL